MIERENEYREILSRDHGSVEFALFADLLAQEGRYGEALEVCLRGLSANPSYHQGRLILARIFFDMGCYPFAAREVSLLARTFPESESIRRLLAKLGPVGAMEAPLSASPAEGEAILAESDFQVEDIDLLDHELRK